MPETRRSYRETASDTEPVCIVASIQSIESTEPLVS